MTTIKTPGRVALMAAASVLALSTAVGADTIRFWTTEEQPERLERQQAMAADFTAETGIEVEVIPVTESDLGTRATAAFAAGDLPDVIYHTLQYALPWYEAGILDADAATEVIESLGADTFASGALEMAAVDEGYASVPVDGWTQMIVYRADLFEENGLEPPTTYANVLAAVEALHNPPEMFGFVAATKVDENFMSQVLEHVFLANGVSPVGPDGFQPLEVGPTTEVLEFYRAIVEASPRGRALLAAVARALLRGAGGDDHLVALHPRRAGRPARQRAADDQRRPDLATSRSARAS
jgi:multiple sugar transport system substrate-binding protein